MKAASVVMLVLLASTARADRPVDATFSDDVRAVNLVAGLVSHYDAHGGYTADYDLVVTAPGPSTLPPFTEHGTVAEAIGHSRWDWGSYTVVSNGTTMLRVDAAREQYIQTRPSLLLEGVLAFTEPAEFSNRYAVTSPSDLQLVLTPLAAGTDVTRIVISVAPTAHGRVTDVTVYDRTGAVNEFAFSNEATSDASHTYFPRDSIAGFKNTTRLLPLPTTRLER